MEPQNDDEDEEWDESTLGLLDERRREVKAQLRVVTSSLREAGAETNGYDTTYFLDPPPPDYANASLHERLFCPCVVRLTDDERTHCNSQRFDFDPVDDVQVHWKASPLGRVKCREVWNLFDVDENDVWSHSEFSEYLAAIEQGQVRIDIHEYASNAEVWAMYMNDHYGLDEDGFLHFDGFVRYREEIEEAWPLAQDLTTLQISLEWPELQHHRAMSKLFDDYVDIDGDGGVPLERAQFLFSEAGKDATFTELRQVLQHQRNLFQCLFAIRQRKRALRLFGYKQKTTVQFTNPDLDEEPRLCKPSFLSLVLSSWTPTAQRRWYSTFLHWRLASYTFLRRMQQTTAWLFAWVRKAASTGLLRARCLQGTPEDERGDYVLRLNIGPSFASRATLHLTYSGEADSAATLHELKYLERGAECFSYVDFVCRGGTRETDAQYVAQKVTWLITEFCSEHLEGLPHFHRWFVTVPSKLQLRSGPGASTSSSNRRPSSGAAASWSCVVRLVVLFTGGMDLYQVMQSLDLPSSMQFDHILQRFTLRMLFSHSLEEVLTNKRFAISSQYAVRGQLDMRLNRKAAGQILRQLVRQMQREEDEVKQDAEAVATEKVKRQDQERQHQLRYGRGKTPQGASNSRKGATTYNQQLKGNGSTVPDCPHTHLPIPSLPTKLERLRSALLRAATLLGHSQEVSLTWVFANCQELLTGNALVRSILTPASFEYWNRLLSGPGALATLWKQTCDSFRAEFATTKYGGQVQTQMNRRLSRAMSKSSILTFDEIQSETASLAQFPYATPDTRRRSQLSQRRRQSTSIEEAAAAAVAAVDGKQPSATPDTARRSIIRRPSTSSVVQAMEGEPTTARHPVLPHRPSVASIASSGTGIETVEDGMGRPPLVSRSSISSVASGYNHVAPADEVPETPAPPEMTPDEQLQHQLMETYDACLRYLSSVNVIRAEAGTSGVTCVVEGWNIFSLLPRIQQGVLNRRATLTRTKSSASNTSNGGGTGSVHTPQQSIAATPRSVTRATS
ncbi:TPA: hypothetical protein N0F65_006612 [Lagenidium giganteum]|uniref:EF-hand domain-containing protein n=1 Tax=Lagenidium giganteum TaxID=4803 RepID=A0AAV2ZB52_9STRA|nr:TPA: hypothetical protein N0F65_006612 [Lagenidium giganteum]